MLRNSWPLSFMKRIAGAAGFSFGVHRYWRVRVLYTSSSGGSPGFADLEMHDTIGGPDLTTGKTATASADGSGAFPASNAIDGSNATFWTAAGAAAPTGGHWIKIDFGAGTEKDIIEIVIRTRNDSFGDDEAPTVFFVEYSDDNSTWVPAWEPLESTGSWAGDTSRTFTPATLDASGHRYWRYRSDDTSAVGEYLAMMTLETRASSGGEDFARKASATTTANFDSSHTGAQAVDGNSGTFWTTGGTAPPAGGHWIKLDYSLKRTVAHVTIKVRSDAFREDPLNLYVEYSDDNSSWTTSWTESPIASWSAGETRTFEP